MRDQIQLAIWLRTGASLADVESVSPVGLVGNTRFSPQAVRAFKLIWSWSAPRFHGEAGIAQESFWHKCGGIALDRRLARCRSLTNKAIGQKIFSEGA